MRAPYYLCDAINAFSPTASLQIERDECADPARLRQRFRPALHALTPWCGWWRAGA